MSKHVESVRAEGLTSYLKVRPDGRVEAVEEWLRSKATAATGRPPMLEAVHAVRRKDLKGMRTALAVELEGVEEPPLRDIGGDISLPACSSLRSRGSS